MRTCKRDRAVHVRSLSWQLAARFWTRSLREELPQRLIEIHTKNAETRTGTSCRRSARLLEPRVSL